MKNEIRLLAKKRRKNIEDISKEILNNFITLQRKLDYYVVGLYYPIRNEVNVLPIIEYLKEINKVVCLPVVNERLIFRKWEAGDPLRENSFKVLEPTNGDILSPDLLIIPLLAFDRKLNRLGYGKGHYDRTISNLNSINVGVAHSIQEFEDIPVEPHDQKLDFVITEKEIIYESKESGDRGISSPYPYGTIRSTISWA